MFTHVHAGCLYALSEQLASLQDLTGSPNSRKGLFETAGHLLDVPVAARAPPTSAATEKASIAGTWIMTSSRGDKFYYSWKAQDKVHNTFSGMQTDEDFTHDRFGVTGTIATSLIGKQFADGSFETEWKCFTGPAASGKFQVRCKATLNGDMDRISDGQYFDEKVRAEPTSRTLPAHCLPSRHP